MAADAQLPPQMLQAEQPQRRRGRPPKDSVRGDARALLIRAGLEMLTEKGYSSAGLDEILRVAAVPKGSFYHYFASKEAFGHALIDAYQSYFAGRLDRYLLNTELSPLKRIEAFIDDSLRGMARHEYRRGCLVGNLGQEMSALPESFRARLLAVFDDWQQRLAQCLREAQQQGGLSPALDSNTLARFFWTGWEGAVLRARLEQNNDALTLFAQGFFQLLGVVYPPAQRAPTGRQDP